MGRPRFMVNILDVATCASSHIPVDSILDFNIHFYALDRNTYFSLFWVWAPVEKPMVRFQDRFFLWTFAQFCKQLSLQGCALGAVTFWRARVNKVRQLREDVQHTPNRGILKAEVATADSHMQMGTGQVEPTHFQIIR